MYPLIELRSESYQHKNREYGRIHVPKFSIVKHVDGARFDEILTASRRGGTGAPAIAGETPKPTPDSGRAEAPAETKPAGDDGYGGDYGGHRGPIDDDVPFAPQWM